MLSALVVAGALAANPEVGKPAPDFTLTGLDGKAVTLSEQRGKTVVLEWFNPGCPFVVYAHEDGGPLQTLASTQPEEVVWIAVNSGAPGKQGHGLEVNERAAAAWKLDHAILLDEKGDVGRLYGATNTPQMFVIDAEGVLRYAGALDNAPMGRLEGERVPYFENALSAVRDGKDVQTPHTKPYGCSVKY